jgi:hypothetical protein
MSDYVFFMICKLVAVFFIFLLAGLMGFLKK